MDPCAAWSMDGRRRFCLRRKVVRDGRDRGCARVLLACQLPIWAVGVAAWCDRRRPDCRRRGHARPRRHCRVAAESADPEITDDVRYHAGLESDPWQAPTPRRSCRMGSSAASDGVHLRWRRMGAGGASRWHGSVVWMTSGPGPTRWCWPPTRTATGPCWSAAYVQQCDGGARARPARRGAASPASRLSQSAPTKRHSRLPRRRSERRAAAQLGPARTRRGRSLSGSTPTGVSTARTSSPWWPWRRVTSRHRAPCSTPGTRPDASCRSTSCARDGSGASPSAPSRRRHETPRATSTSS